MMVPPKARRSTIAAHRRGPVKVFVQPEKPSLLAMAMAFFFPLGQHLEQQLGAALVESHIAEFVQE
jgi:hypothetical protein